MSDFASRQAKATDYAKMLGVYVDLDNGNSNWWLRSPSFINSYASIVRFDGNDYNNYINNSNCGIRPAITIKK